jgi:hypothetical protein
VLLSWINPPEADLDENIKITANGAVVATLPGDATTHTIADPPAGPLTITVANFSQTAVSCFLCENALPVVVIDGPASVPFADDGVTVSLDSSRSTDGDDGTQALSRSWELISAPEGGNASLDDPAGISVKINMHAEGDYVIRLSIMDSGCAGSPPMLESAEHTITVFRPSAGGSQRPGDCNQDGKLDISDAVCLLGHLFLGAPSVLPCEGGTTADPGNKTLFDANGDGGVDLSDAVNELLFLFSGGPPPKLGTECVVIVGCPDKCQ